MTLPFAQQSFPEVYEQFLLGPLFRPWAEALLEQLNPAKGSRFLDVACGTGIVARLAKPRVGPAGKVVGVDLNGGMLAVARRVAPKVDWREGNATALPIGEGEQFDTVACQQGFQFIADRSAAAQQMRRALVPDGRVGISTWRPDHESPVLLQLRQVAERRAGPIEDRRHSLGEPGPLEAVLREAGFRDIQTRTESRTIRFEDGMMFARLNALALVGMSAGGKTLSESDRERLIEDIVRESGDIVARNSAAGAFQYDIGINVTIARA